LNSPWTVGKENVLYKCGWSPLREKLFMQSDSYFVNGNIVYENGSFSRFSADQRLKFKQKTDTK
jgi:dihydroorotase